MKSPPKRHQTLKNTYAPQVMEASMGGVMNAMMKLLIQLDAALIDVPLARIDSGKISAISVQDPGPQLYAKLMMYSQTMLTAAQPAAV